MMDTLDGLRRVRVIDSHTAGEPTRVVLDGGPELGDGPLADRLERFRHDHDAFRSAVVNEPRGSDVLVGALLTPPTDPSAAAAVIFFNNVGTLGMCGHGTIGVVETLRHLGRIGAGRHRVETPVGTVLAELHGDGRVSVDNVPSYRHRAAVRVDVPGLGRVVGDVAWGGNWFFLVGGHGASGDHGASGEPSTAVGLPAAAHQAAAAHRSMAEHTDPTPAPRIPPIGTEHLEELTDYAWAIREGLARAGITGKGGAEIDHIELFAPTPTADSRSFVLCPGKAYDRSPCGTGTSAKLACLQADGDLAEGALWRQESVIGSIFDARYVLDADGRVIPTITGRAFVTGDSTLLFDAGDPFRCGIR